MFCFRKPYPPYFLRPTLKEFGTSENFSSISVDLNLFCGQRSYYTLIFQKYDIHPSNLFKIPYKAKSLDREKIGYCDLHFFCQRSHHYD